MRTSRRWLAILMVSLAMLLIVPLGVGAAPPASEEPSLSAVPIPGAATTVRAPNGLRLRIGPSLADPVILVLRNGETVYPSAGPVWREGISWSFVRVYRYGYWHEGFCASAYLGGYACSQPTGEHGLKVVASALNLRSGPGLGYAVRRTVPYGTILQPTGAVRWAGGRSWTQVRIDGVYMWGATAFLVAV